MTKSLLDFPRPANDNGRGILVSADPNWLGGDEGYDFWVAELSALGVTWAKIADEGGNSLPFCEKLLAAGIFPIVHIIRRDPPPNDTLEPNPGHISPADEDAIRRLLHAGVCYFETNSEPNLVANWKHHAMPGDAVEVAKIIALNWLFDARFIIEAGGYPGLPAISSGGNLDIMGALVALGRHDVLSEGAWIAVHNYASNRPLNFPDDPANRTAQTLTKEQFDQRAYTEWAWWNQPLDRANTVEEINQARQAGKNSIKSVIQDHSCFREFEYYNFLAMKYLGNSIPILGTEGGYRIGRRDDPRYPRITPQLQSDYTIALFEFMQKQAPDYYFVSAPAVLVPTANWEAAAWYGTYWQRALSMNTGRNGLPPIAVVDTLGSPLPVVQALKQMPNIARRLPGSQPVPPPTIELPSEPAPKPEALAGTEEYTIQQGESLSIIARKFGTTWQAIAILNQITTPNLIRPGQTVLVPTLPKEEVPIELDEPEPPPVPFQPVPESEPGAAYESIFMSSPPPQSIPEKPLPPAIPYRHVSVARNVYQLKTVRPAPDALRARPGREVFPPVEISPPELDWDSRLEAFNIGSYPVEVDRGKKFWKLVRALYQGPEESGENHNVYFTTLDENNNPLTNQRVWLGWRGNKTYAFTDANGQAAIALSTLYVGDEPVSDLYFVGVEGLASDRVAGISLNLKRNESFVYTWKRTVQR